MSSDYDIRYKLKENSLLIKVVDKDLTIFKKKIKPNHPFVNTYLQGKLSVLLEFLNVPENITLSEDLNKICLTLSKPIYLTIDLDKETPYCINANLKNEILSKFGQLRTEFERYKVQNNIRISEIEKQLSYGVILPGYSEVISIYADYLLINYIHWEKTVRNDGYTIYADTTNGLGQSIDINKFTDRKVKGFTAPKLESFRGYTLEPLRYLKYLTKLYLRHIDGQDTITDISPIYTLHTLHWLRIDGFHNITTVDFSNFKNLKVIVLSNLESLNDISSLSYIDISQLHIYNCPQICNIPKLKESVKIEKL